jgi:hypothetical protein
MKKPSPPKKKTKPQPQPEPRELKADKLKKIAGGPTKVTRSALGME